MNTERNRRAIRIEFERIVDRELSSLLHTAELVVHDQRRAEDLVVDAVSEAFRRSGKVPAPASSLRSELYRAMVGLAYGRFLPWTSQPTAFSIDDAERIEPCRKHLEPLPQDLDHDAVETIVHELPHPLRLVVVLSLVAGFSYDEIGLITGLPRETVRSRMSRGRQLLHRILCRSVRGDAAVQPGQN